jgi:putative transcriptional regulator
MSKNSDAMAAIHETIEALHDINAIDKQTMRRFDDACLTPIWPLTPQEIKAIREREHVSQTVFANYLNVTTSLVSKCERRQERPSGPPSNYCLWSGKRGWPRLHKNKTTLPIYVRF